MMRFSPLGLAAVLLLSACGKAGEGPAASAAPQRAASAASPAGMPAPAPAHDPAQPPAAALSPQFMIGRWGDNGDCTRLIEYRADGVFYSYNGGAGRWALRGDQMVMASEGRSFTVRLERVSETAVMVFNPDGTYAISQRC